MPVASMRCARCGYTQMASPTCKSCGAALNGQPARSAPSDAPPKQAASPARAANDPEEVRQLFFSGSGGSLFGIHVVNAFLTVVTLGIYYFWSKVKVRRYIFSQTEFDGDRFSFLGTGRELMLGFFKALLAIGALSILINATPYLPGGQVSQVAVFVFAYGTLLIFAPLAIVGSRRYRLSRSSWRGIRFSFRGRVGTFIKIFVKGALLTLVTLGLYYPVFISNRYAYLTSHSYFGNQKFDFDGRGGQLLGGYLLALLLLIPTAGISWLWFLAKKKRYLWRHTLFSTARFNCTVTGGRLFLLKLGNLILLILSLGLAWPWVQVRNVKFEFRYLTLEGPIDLEEIKQDAQSASPTGEGLGDILNIDTGLSTA